MRIIHDIEHPCQVSAGARHSDVYAKTREEDVSHGFAAEILICTNPPEPGDLLHFEEAIHIEGNALHILQALEAACAMIRHTGAEFVKAGKLAPDWDDIKAYEARRDARKIDAKLPRRRRAVHIQLADGWVATEMEATQGKSSVMVFMVRNGNTSAASRFSTTLRRFIDYPGEASNPDKWLVVSPQVVDELMDNRPSDDWTY